VSETATGQRALVA